MNLFIYSSEKSLKIIFSVIYIRYRYAAGKIGCWYKAFMFIIFKFQFHIPYSVSFAWSVNINFINCISIIKKQNKSILKKLFKEYE